MQEDSRTQTQQQSFYSRARATYPAWLGCGTAFHCADVLTCLARMTGNRRNSRPISLRMHELRRLLKLSPQLFGQLGFLVMGRCAFFTRCVCSFPQQPANLRHKRDQLFRVLLLGCKFAIFHPLLIWIANHRALLRGRTCKEVSSTKNTNLAITHSIVHP